MDKDEQTVADDLVVSLAYTLLVNGEELDQADDDDPMLFLQGHSNIIPGLEKELYGMSIGDTKQVTVAPAEAYGELDPSKRDEIPLEMMPADYEPVVGDALHLRDTESNEVFEVYVAEIDDDKIFVDFNHPLAGETLQFQVKVVDLRPATSEELAHGHVHDGSHDH